MRIDKNTTIRLGDRNIVKIKIGDSVIWQKTTEPDYFYVENTYDGGNNISVKQTITGSPDSSLYAKTLQYSKDKTNWSTITLSSTAYTITLNKGEKVYFRGNEGVLNYYANDGAIKTITNILGTQTHTIGGNINTLVNYITPNELTLTQGVFAELFQSNTTITSAENLTLQPSSDGSLSIFAYYLMFSGCSALITPPSEIPATKQGHASCSKMFLDCTQLKTPPALKSTILGNYCFTSIFKNCTSLISAPELPALTLASNCYQSAFEGCTSLKVAPELPANVLANYCYQALFKGCSALTTPPTIIPAETAPYISCHRMFNDCVSLQSAPELSPTTLGSGAYQYMFMGCSQLTTAPSELPAETLALNSYYEMFRGCSQLTTAPTIKAKTFAENSCQGMFVSCSSLNSITVYADDISANRCTNNWLSGVASTGTFNNYGTATYTTNSPSGIPSGWTEVKPVVEPEYFYIESLGDGNTISVINQGDGSTSGVTPTLEYSTDKNTWNIITFDWTSGTHTTELPVKLNTGGKMYFRNDTRKFSSLNDKYITFSPSVSSNVGGDIRTLSNYLDVYNEIKPQSYMFRDLFNDNKNIVDASNLRLPYTTLADGCYFRIFQSCTSLTTAPSLPATTLAANCYHNAFNRCTSLVNAPALPAKTLAVECYRALFYGCTSLLNVPELPAKVLVEGCYRDIFRGCSKLNNITVYANDISATYCTTNWLRDASSTGTFHNLGSATYPRNGNGIPPGWTEVKN